MTAFFEDPVTRALVARQRRFEKWTRLAVSIGFVLFFIYHLASSRLAEKQLSFEIIGLFLLFAVILAVVFTVVQWLLGQFFFAPTRYGNYGRCAKRMERWAKSTIAGLRCKVWSKPVPQLLGMETVNWSLIVDGPATGYTGMIIPGHLILDARLCDHDPAALPPGLLKRLSKRLLPAYHAVPKRRWWLEITFTPPGERAPVRAVYPFGKFRRDAENWRQCILSLKN